MHRENNHALATATTITASMLYDFVHCPHRVWMDLFADQTKRDEASPFVQLLWERGAAHENDVVAGISGTFVDLSHYRGDEKERQTLAAMDRGSDLIYSGRISSGDLLGEPDLLRRDGTGYVAGDIKSGAGAEGATDESEGKPKKHYAVQLALYTDVLERLARSPGRRAFVWDIHGKELLYDFAAEDGTGKSQRLWDYYQECLGEARAIISKTKKTLPAYASGICTNCLWYTACINTLETANDLTLIPELGRSKRDAMIDRVHSIRELAETSVDRFINGQKTVFPGIGPATLAKFHARAQLLTTRGKPYLRAPVVIPSAARELFFDIEVDPMRDICYLHGFVERHAGDNATERFVSLFTEDPSQEAEERAFADAVRHITTSQPCMVYYYSKYERTIYRVLRKKYPHVCTEAQIEAIFDPVKAIDLYFDVVLKSTEWPTRDFSIKTLARYLGFNWNDPHPSGAASIEWFNRWVEQRDPSIRKQLLVYNEDDCRATRVLLDAIRQLPLKLQKEA
jgi:predicted RecB family nuclease